MTVEDEGPGIPPDNLESIFERFYTERPGDTFGKQFRPGPFHRPPDHSKAPAAASGRKTVRRATRPGQRRRALGRRIAAVTPMPERHDEDVNIHASCVAIGGKGVLLLGDSGAGKSDLALRLIDEGARLVADDRAELYRRARRTLRPRARIHRRADGDARAGHRRAARAAKP